MDEWMGAFVHSPYSLESESADKFWVLGEQIPAPPPIELSWEMVNVVIDCF